MKHPRHCLIKIISKHLEVCLKYSSTLFLVIGVKHGFSCLIYYMTISFHILSQTSSWRLTQLLVLSQKEREYEQDHGPW